MKKKASLLVALLLVCSMIFSGCLQYVMEFNIKADMSAEFTLMTGMKKEYISFFQGEDVFAELRELGDEPNMKAEDYDDGTYAGVKITGKIENVTAEDEDLEYATGTDMMLKKETVNGKTVLTLILNAEAAMGELMESMTDEDGNIDPTLEPDMRIIFTFPYPVTCANADEISKDGKTVTWDMMKLDGDVIAVAKEGASGLELPLGTVEEGLGGNHGGNHGNNGGDDDDDFVIADHFVILNDYITNAIYDYRDYSALNMTGAKLDGIVDPVLLLTEDAAEALKEVNDLLFEEGYCLKIMAAYRPMKAIEGMNDWANDILPDGREEDEIFDSMIKSLFYPHMTKEDILDAGYIKEDYCRGSSVDVMLYDLAYYYELDHGTPYGFMDPSASPDYDGELEEHMIDNRDMLIELMGEYGFTVDPDFWWHFTYDDEEFPDTYFDFDVDLDLYYAEEDDNAMSFYPFD